MLADAMLWSILVALLILWLLGFGLHVGGGLSHPVPVMAVVVLIHNLVSGGRRSIVQNDIEQRAVDLQAAIVVNETQFPESVHEKADPRTSGTDHSGQGLLTDLGDHVFRHTLLAKM